LLPGRVVEGGRLDDRPEPGERDRRRYRQGGYAGERRLQLASDEQRPGDREADQGDADEERVRRVDERERSRGGRRRQGKGGWRAPNVREEEREQSRHEQLP